MTIREDKLHTMRQPRDTILYFVGLLVTRMQAEIGREGETTTHLVKDQHSRRVTSHVVVPTIIWEKINAGIKTLASCVELKIVEDKPYFIRKDMVQVEFKK